MAIQKTEAYFNSSDQKHKIRTLIWQEEELTPIGVFQIAHGMAEHIERYDDFARFLASNGFIVCGNDHLGHGKSVNSLSELGFFAEENGDKRLVDDMHILTQIMKKHYPDLPYFLFGHSMGSFCARIYAAHFGYELQGAIFCGTGEVPATAEVILPVIKDLSQKFGPMKEAKYLPKLMNASCNLMLLDKENEPRKEAIAWLSKDLQNRTNYANDFYCGFPLKIGGYRDLFALACECGQKEWAESVPKDLPIMVISGAQDPVGFNGKGPLFVADNLALAGIDPTVILYPGDRHEILLEQDHDRVYADILSWLHTIYLGDAAEFTE